MDAKHSYDRVAAEYARRIFGELTHKPFDREILARFAARLPAGGTVCDLGCGPGHVARYLADIGVAVTGIDLSPQMVAQARRLSPTITFQRGDLRALDVEDQTWAGIVCFYAIIHIPRDEIVATLRELWRTLRPGGLLLLAFHVGDRVVHAEEWLGEQVDLDFVFFQRETVEQDLHAAGFAVIESVEREPYPVIEVQTHRAYLLAQRPV